VSTIPYGAWPSPLSPETLSAARVSISNLQVGPDGSWWWSESRPEEGGRQVVVRRRPGEPPSVVSPDGISVRTRVHEYGGAAFTVADDELVYVSLEDEGLWACPAGGGVPRRLSLLPPSGERHRYGDPQDVPGRGWVVAVRERHHAGGVDDEVVALPRLMPARVPPGDEEARGAPATVLVSGRDFFGAARPDRRGARLAWTAWDHPNMPWDGCELFVAPLEWDAEGVPRVGHAQRVAGGPAESVGQPVWSADGALCFASDRHDWWQPYRWDGGEPRRMCAEEAEFHSPDWVLGQATMAPLDDGRLACRFRRAGTDHVGLVDQADGSLAVVAQPCVSVYCLRAAGPGLLAVAGAGAAEPVAVHAVSLTGSPPEFVHRPRSSPLPAGWTSRPEALTYRSAGGSAAHMLFFAPVAPDIHGPPDASPPLVVHCHGGPTGAAECGFDLTVQLWTTRGYAVALVDYRGSSGYGRAYRGLLRDAWGIADAEDAIAAARFLAETGRVDRARMVVRGGSAGGYTALRALQAGGPFAAALVSYGVTDLAALARDTHKFESRYLDGLVGPWPAAADVYDARSPALHPEEIDGAVLLLQGEDDPVVPPDQARRMAEVLRARGMRCDLELFAGEGHGFRRAETLARAAELEIAFAASVLDLPVAT